MKNNLVKFLFKGKRRTMNMILCALFAAACALLVTAMDQLENKYGLRTDLSFNAISTQSEATKNVLKELDMPVHVYAVFSEGSEDAQLIELLNRYQAQSEMFTWSQENLTHNPLLLEMVSDDLNDAGVTSDCLIIRCAENDRTRVLTGENYVQYGYNTETGYYEITGWTYEKSITQAILYVTSAELAKVQILTGYGELSETDTADMEKELTDANYEIVRVNLVLGDTPDPAYPLMILSPTRDLAERELNTLTDFTRAGGNLFITIDFDSPDELPNFYALYRQFGFEPLPGLLLANEGETGTYYQYINYLQPEMNYTDVTGVLKTAGLENLILPDSRALEMPQNVSDDLLIDVCLYTGEKAYIRANIDENAPVYDQQPDDLTGQFALALCADKAYSDGTRSRAFIIGNSFIFDDYMFDYTDSDELLLQSMQYLRNKEDINLDIIARDAVRAQMQFDSASVPAVLLTLAPLMVLVIALGVLRPRKHL